MQGQAKTSSLGLEVMFPYLTRHPESVYTKVGVNSNSVAFSVCLLIFIENCRRYIAGILPIRLKTRDNQSINIIVS